MSAPQTPRPSGTVVVVRDAKPCFELLLLERTPRDGEPQPWVFPGGKVDAADLRGGEDEVAAARRAAVREALEEAGLTLDVASLLPISRWITPEISPKRFDTWFFLAPLRGSAAVRVDGGEIQGHRWLSPREALALHEQKTLRLAPPTYVTVTTLAAYDGVETALHGCASCELPTFRPRIVRIGEGAVMLYPGDAGYDAQDADRPGPRHRLWALAGGWRYERDLAGAR
ncbi:MAG TPA: NUDIX hydrolase [Myxococcota bacterium]|nr:NUDIX hydrolase [Myxococcota bacterium]